MSRHESEQLLERLPAIHRARDAKGTGQLRELLALLQEQHDAVEDDIDGLYEDLFVETCSEWAVLYIGDLLGVRGLTQLRSPTYTQRSWVANTIRYRRRKGTTPMLETLARDVAGTGAHVQPFFELLGWAQHLDHLRRLSAPNPGGRNPPSTLRVGTANLRDLNATDLIDGPFDLTSHSVDIRPPDQASGWHNIRSVGFFLWRLLSLPLERTTARASADHPHGFHVCPLGGPVRLFTRPEPPEGAHRPEPELTVPGPIRAVALHRDLGGRVGASTIYGPGKSLQLFPGGGDEPVPSSMLMCKDLRDWDHPPAGVWVRRSGAISFPVAGASPPEVGVRLEGEAARVALLEAHPLDIEDAADKIQDAIRGLGAAVEADGGDRIAVERARVVADGGRLLVLPGRTGVEIAFETTDDDPDTASELELLDAQSEVLLGVRSAPVDPIPPLAVRRHGGPLALAIQAGGHQATVELDPVPETLGDLASELEAAVQAVDPGDSAVDDAIFSQARTYVVDGRLLLLPGKPGTPVAVKASSLDGSSANELGLIHRVAVDPVLGRVTFPVGWEPDSLEVSFSYGFPAPTGGGPYDRRRGRLGSGTNGDGRSDTVDHPGALDVVLSVGPGGDHHATIQDALKAWKPALGTPEQPRRRAVVQIEDDRTYAGPVTIGSLVTSGVEGVELVIQAANGHRPVLTDDLRVLESANLRRLVLDGVVLEGQLKLENGVELTELGLRHATLVPGTGRDETGEPVSPTRASLRLTAEARANVRIESCVIGALAIPRNAGNLEVQDSIVEATTPGGAAIGGATPGELAPPATIERCTVLGRTRVLELWGSETIFRDLVEVGRRQRGCLRFSYAPVESSTPRRHRCQPDRALEDVPPGDTGQRARILSRLTPLFTSTRYGDPGYAQLATVAPPEILRGGEDGSEMGAYNLLKLPLREDNLRAQLQEYLPVGLEAGVIHVT